MPTFRVHVVKKRTKNGGGDNVRIHDVEADDEQAAVKAAKIKASEEVETVVTLWDGQT